MSEDNSGEEDLILWQDVLDSVAAGRADGIVCPFCKGGTIVVDKQTTRGIRVSCPKCKKYIEGSLGPEYE